MITLSSFPRRREPSDVACPSLCIERHWVPAFAGTTNYDDPRPRTVETLSQPAFIAMKKQSMEIFQREVRP